MKDSSFERLGGLLAIVAGAGGLFYTIAFIVLQNGLLSALFLTIVGLASSAAVVALYGRLTNTSSGFARYALLLGLLGTIGAAIHGGYDLANAIHPPSTASPTIASLPSQIDPRGLLTFGITGVALLIFSWLITRSTLLPRGLGYLGYLSGLLSILLYLGRLIILQPTDPILLVPALLNGFIAGPLWYIWLGIALWQQAMVTSPAYQGPERRMAERRQAI